TSMLSGQRITDCTSGFRALDRRAMEIFVEEYPLDFPDASALIYASFRGLRIAEVPILYRARPAGRSSLRSLQLLFYPLRQLYYILKVCCLKKL
ncbi:MAG: glycosyltransferase family 2 protein, partial [Thermoprotei archaeon]